MSFPFLSAMSDVNGAVWVSALDAAIKVTLLLSAAGVVTWTLGRASAALRHLVWTLALVSALALPMLSIALPRWQLPIVTLAAPASAPAAAQEDAAQAPPLSRRERTPSAAIESGPPAPSDASQSVTRALGGMSWSSWLLAIWAAGVAAILGRLLVGLIAVQWMSRRTEAVVDAPWLPLAEDLVSDLGITRRVRFLRSARATMPMACGLVRPVVLVPADADRWPSERMRIVLLHELAHVKRRDCLTHVVAQLACALYWFNPLAWIAARHIRTERERACDDLVLAAGTHGPDYAEELLEIARVMRAGRFPALMAGATLAMAHRSQLEGRLIAILDPKVPRSGVTRFRTAIATATVACALAPLATLQPWAVAQATAVTPSEAMASAATSSGQEREAAQSVPQPTPMPNPNPNPNPTPRIAVDLPRDVVEAAAAVGDEAAQAAAQAAIQGTVQSVTQSMIQGTTQGMIQGMVQGFNAGQEGQSGKPAQEGQGGKPATDPRMVAALTAALKDSDKEVRETAMHALIQLRDPSIFEPLVQALKDSSPDVREQAAQGLAQLRDRRAVDPLMGALKDLNPSVREAAVHGLGQLRDARTVDAIAGVLKDESASVREQAAFALGQLRDPKSVDGLIAALKDQNADVREQAAFALGQLRDRRATAALAAAIKDADADVREQVVFALGQIRDGSAVEGLVSALRDAKPDVRQQAVFALGQIRDPRAVEPLISSLKDENADVRQQAAFALGQLRDRAAVEALVIAIKDPDADVREQVAFALGQLRDPRAIDALTAALKDPNADVRQQAAFALGQLAR
jgi:HEAT repeat protein/beta-lactamase regulating signal transducer with metallopeptidase domain